MDSKIVSRLTSQSHLTSDEEVDKMLGIGNVVDLNLDHCQFNLPVIGLDTNLASSSSYNLELFDLHDFSSTPSTTISTILENKVDQHGMLKSDSVTLPAETKQSPWHESDSGMSEAMSFAESPLGGALEEMSLQQDFMFPDLLDVQAPEDSDLNLIDPSNTTVTSFLEDLEADTPIAVDVQVDAFPHPNQVLNDNSGLNNSKRPVRKCVAQRKFDIVDVESTDSEDEIKTSPVVKTKEQREIEDLSYFSGRNFAPGSNIKILKVVKPTNSGNDASADEIMKALDDRSKKNARQAKINREKKKAYISGLESDIEKLQKENSSLVAENKEMKDEMVRLEDEVSYLKSVLANASALSGLLKNLNNVKEVKLSATISGKKRGAEDDHNYNLVESRPEKRARGVRENLRKAGVCLHVSDGEACLEFCAHCASLASKTHKHRNNKL